MGRAGIRREPGISPNRRALYKDPRTSRPSGKSDAGTTGVCAVSGIAATACGPEYDHPEPNHISRQGNWQRHRDEGSSGGTAAGQADPVQIEQVLMNLCLNARDAMPEGGRLTIETEMQHIDETFCRFYSGATPGWYAVLSVSDTGIGMTQEVRERIFEPFFTTKERGTGSGMGLATAYGIVKQHGGFIHVYSEPWQGSLFRVYLPSLQGTNAETKRMPQAAEFSRSTSMDGTETILLAEDHDSVREMARQWLVNLGYKVLSAANGEEAARLCEQEVPALAILDVVMPRMGGTATATLLRSHFPSLPVLFTSGYSESTGAAVSQLANSYYLQKPYSPTSLGRVLRKILDAPMITES
jgi:two-component system, cell cycle sensor histidine kinase and response regulator CckA